MMEVLFDLLKIAFLGLLLLACLVSVAVLLVKRAASNLAREELARRVARAEIILGDCHDLLCDLLEDADLPTANTVLETSQETWALKLVSEIQEYKNPDLCRKNPLPKHR